MNRILLSALPVARRVRLDYPQKSTAGYDLGPYLDFYEVLVTPESAPRVAAIAPEQGLGFSRVVLWRGHADAPREVALDARACPGDPRQALFDSGLSPDPRR